MRTCVYCGAEFSDERPYSHCAKPDCVATWKHERRAGMGITLLPKQGFEIVYLKDASSVPARSSGR